jgi:photosystem II PsbY protein
MAGASFLALASEAESNNQSQLLLFVVAPAIGWVLYNILQPALNQLKC